MAHLNQNKIYDVLCSKKAKQTNDGDKWLCEIVHIADLLNYENLIQIQTQLKLLLPAKLRAIYRQKNTNHTTSKRLGEGEG